MIKFASEITYFHLGNVKAIFGCYGEILTIGSDLEEIFLGAGQGICEVECVPGIPGSPLE